MAGSCCTLELTQHGFGTALHPAPVRVEGHEGNALKRVLLP